MFVVMSVFFGKRICFKEFGTKNKYNFPLHIKLKLLPGYMWDEVKNMFSFRKLGELTI